MMHIHGDRPACWRHRLPKPNPKLAPFIDHGLACGNYLSEESETATLTSTPGCIGCARLSRARKVRHMEKP